MSAWGRSKFFFVVAPRVSRLKLSSTLTNLLVFFLSLGSHQANEHSSWRHSLATLQTSVLILSLLSFSLLFMSCSVLSIAPVPSLMVQPIDESQVGASLSSYDDLQADTGGPGTSRAYYVAQQGDDAWDGTSPTRPWQTIDRVNKQDFEPGNKVLFKGGQTFVGSVLLNQNDSGAKSNPVVLSSYGDGPALISSGEEAGLFGYNVSNITVTNLHFRGGGAATNDTHGVDFFVDAPEGGEGIRLSSLDVSGYGKNGIVIGSWHTANGYRGVRITSSATHHNADGGLLVYAQAPNTHRDVYIGRVTASYNSCVGRNRRHSGNGIVLGGVKNGMIESSRAFENGRRCVSLYGPVGIWAYDATNVTIQNNQSFRNGTGKTDGDGFDLDNNVSYSLMQNNTSYENDGAGYLLAQFLNSNQHTNNIIQNNTSINDGRKLTYGGILVWGRVRNAIIRNNTVTMSPVLSTYVSAIMITNWTKPSLCAENIQITENNLTASSGASLVIITTEQLRCAQGLLFNDNVYQGDPFSIRWGVKTYDSIASWRDATGQEETQERQAFNLEEPMSPIPNLPIIRSTE